MRIEWNLPVLKRLIRPISELECHLLNAFGANQGKEIFGLKKLLLSRIKLISTSMYHLIISQ